MSEPTGKTTYTVHAAAVGHPAAGNLGGPAACDSPRVFYGPASVTNLIEWVNCPRCLPLLYGHGLPVS